MKHALSYSRISQRSSEGFTLLETLVAVFIFSLALVSLVVISSRGIIVTTTAKNRSIAQFLAQEGIELVEHKRDSNFLNTSASWLDGLDNCQTSLNPSGCQVDAISSTNTLDFRPCSGDCQLLNVTSNGIYGYGAGETTPFRRTLYIDSGMFTGSAVGDSSLVRSVVSWRQGGAVYSVESQKYLTNWF